MVPASSTPPDGTEDVFTPVLLIANTKFPAASVSPVVFDSAVVPLAEEPLAVPLVTAGVLTVGVVISVLADVA